MTNTNETDATQTHDEVRAYYRQAALASPALESTDCCAPGPDTTNTLCCDPGGVWGASQYDAASLADGSTAAANLSMGCGNPYAMADLVEGETVLDLGSGGGLDVILSAKRVGTSGQAYGVDFLPEMLEIARKNADDEGLTNVEFLEGMIEDLPLPDDSIDVVISNCVINLAPDKTPVFAEIARVLKPGGRVAISDVVCENDFTPPTGGEAWSECATGALEYDDYLAMLGAAGLAEPSIEYTHETGPGLHGAIVRATKPGLRGRGTARPEGSD